MLPARTSEASEDPMKAATAFSTPSDARNDARPSDEELDLFGITHPGRVRTENQDHFLVCTVHPQVVVHATSLPDAKALPLRGTRLASVMLVADGVGGGEAGSEASRLAAEAIARYVSSTLRSYHAAGTSEREGEFLEALRAAALEAHEAVRAESQQRPQRTDGKTMATTLTMAIFVWPWLYVVQVGDSRCYHYVDGTLTQITRDQTLAQDLVDQGVLPAERLASSPFTHVLSSAIGSDEAKPVVSRFKLVRAGVTMLCSDGLTKHVSDDEIAKALATMTSAEQVSRELLQLALDRGGRDNITVLVGRAPLRTTPKSPPSAVG